MKNRKRRGISSKKSSKHILSKGVETAKSHPLIVKLWPKPFAEEHWVDERSPWSSRSQSNFLYSRRSYMGTIDVIYYIRTERFPRAVMPGNNNTQLSWRETKFLQTSRGCT